MINSWKRYQTEAQTFFRTGNYVQAQEKYLDALHLVQSPSDRALLLSNLVVCRIKNGGSVNLNLAVEEAKECISLREGWSKGYIRLASAYIALGGHSNDACQALQSAIRLDPTNSTARRMLTNELRRERLQTRDDVNDIDIDFVEEGEHANNVPMLERLQLAWRSGVEWYNCSDENTKILVKISIAVLILYIAFGGRFGLDSLFSSNDEKQLGNYGRGNAYDRYYSRTNSNNGRGYGSYTSSASFNEESRRDRYDYNDSYQYNSRNTGRRHNYSDNSFIYMLATMAMIFGLNMLGVPIHHRGPMGRYGPMGGFGMRRMNLGGVNIGFGGGGINFGMGGFRPRYAGHRRWF